MISAVGGGEKARLISAGGPCHQSSVSNHRDDVGQWSASGRWLHGRRICITSPPLSPTRSVALTAESVVSPSAGGTEAGDVPGSARRRTVSLTVEPGCRRLWTSAGTNGSPAGPESWPSSDPHLVNLSPCSRQRRPWAEPRREDQLGATLALLVAGSGITPSFCGAKMSPWF